MFRNAWRFNEGWTLSKSLPCNRIRSCQCPKPHGQPPPWFACLQRGWEFSCFQTRYRRSRNFSYHPWLLPSIQCARGPQRPSSSTSFVAVGYLMKGCLIWDVVKILKRERNVNKNPTTRITNAHDIFERDRINRVQKTISWRKSNNVPKENKSPLHAPTLWYD